MTPLVSRATSLARVWNTTYRPPAATSAPPLAAFAWPSDESTLTRTVPVGAAAAVGTAAVMGWSLDPGRSAGDVPITVDVRYTATAPWDLGTGSWQILLDDGSTRDMTVTGTTPSASLPSGRTLDLKVRGTVPTNAGSPFVGYVDAQTGEFIFVVAVE